MKKGQRSTKKRATLFSVLLFLLFGLTFLAIFSYNVLYWIGYSFTQPPSVYHFGIWAIPFYVGAGILLSTALRTRDINRGICDPAIIGAVIMFTAVILTGVMTVLTASLWARCVLDAGSLDDTEEIQCDNDVYQVYIQIIWAIVFVILSVADFAALSVDAFLRFDAASNIGGAKELVKKAASKVGGKSK